MARDWYALPAAIFTDPEIAVVGMTEAEARAAGHAVKVGRFPFSASGRALALGETEGLVKVVASEDRLLGVGIAGAEASELIGEAALALEMVAAAEDVALTIHPHPTLSEGVAEAFKHALGEAIHIANRKPSRAKAEGRGGGGGAGARRGRSGAALPERKDSPLENRRRPPPRTGPIETRGRQGGHERAREPTSGSARGRSGGLDPRGARWTRPLPSRS